MKWATVVRAGLVLLALLAFGCETDGARLIPTSDPEFAELETPEAAGECVVDSDCEHSCVHTCTPVNSGPTTCPTIPPPVPERIATATCKCAEQLCAWFE